MAFIGIIEGDSEKSPIPSVHRRRMDSSKGCAWESWKSAPSGIRLPNFFESRHIPSERRG